MKKTFNVLSVRLFGLAVVIAAIALNAMLITGCNSDDDDVPPENKPVKDRWGKYIEPGTTATLDYSVADDGVCTITVGGTAEPNGENRWKVNAQYYYTAKAGASYKYTFEAWTESGTRELGFQYNVDNDEKIYLWEGISITNTRKTYTVYGAELSKGVLNQVEFQCADQLGTFYVKILEIKEYTTGKLTVTNFAGILTVNSLMNGEGWQNQKDASDLIFSASGIRIDDDGYILPSNITIRGNTLTMNVFKVNRNNNTYAPFTGSATLAEGGLLLEQINFTDNGEWIGYDYYYNKVPITFTNGNATINFGTQMEKRSGAMPPAGGGGKSPDGTWEGKNTYLGSIDNGAKGKTFTVVISGDDITITGNDKELKGKLVDDPDYVKSPTEGQGLDEYTFIYKEIKKGSDKVGALTYCYAKASAGGETFEIEILSIDIDPTELGGWVSLETEDLGGDLARKK